MTQQSFHRQISVHEASAPFGRMWEELDGALSLSVEPNETTCLGLVSDLCSCDPVSSPDGEIAVSLLCQSKTMLQAVMADDQCVSTFRRFPGSLPSEEALHRWVSVAQSIVRQTKAAPWLLQDGEWKLDDLLCSLHSTAVRDFICFLVCSSRTYTLESPLLKGVVEAMVTRWDHSAVQANGAKILRRCVDLFRTQPKLGAQFRHQAYPAIAELLIAAFSSNVESIPGGQKTASPISIHAQACFADFLRFDAVVGHATSSRGSPTARELLHRGHEGSLVEALLRSRHPRRTQGILSVTDSTPCSDRGMDVDTQARHLPSGEAGGSLWFADLAAAHFDPLCAGLWGTGVELFASIEVFAALLPVAPPHIADLVATHRCCPAERLCQLLLHGEIIHALETEHTARATASLLQSMLGMLCGPYGHLKSLLLARTTLLGDLSSAHITREVSNSASLMWLTAAVLWAAEHDSFVADTVSSHEDWTAVMEQFAGTSLPAMLDLHQRTVALRIEGEVFSLKEREKLFSCFLSARGHTSADNAVSQPVSPRVSQPVSPSFELKREVQRSAHTWEPVMRKRRRGCRRRFIEVQSTITVP